MLRRILHIILALFLLVSTSGITLSMHYCGGTLVSTSINKEAKSCCDGAGGCCENTIVHFEIEDDYVSPVQLSSIKVLESDVLFSFLYILNFDLSVEEEITINIFNDSSPPKSTQTHLALLQTYLC